MRARVTRHEDYSADGDVRLEQPVGGDDRSDCVGVKVKRKLVKGTVPLISTSLSRPQLRYTQCTL